MLNFHEYLIYNYIKKRRVLKKTILKSTYKYVYTNFRNIYNYIEMCYEMVYILKRNETIENVTNVSVQI